MAKRKSDAAIEMGCRLAARRGELGLSQMTVAEVADVHFSYVSDVERGVRNMSTQNLLRLAAALEIDPAEIVQGLKPDGWRSPRKKIK